MEGRREGGREKAWERGSKEKKGEGGREGEGRREGWRGKTQLLVYSIIRNSEKCCRTHPRSD